MSVRPGASGRLREERGVALVLSLVILLSFGIAVTTLIHYTTANTSSTSRQRADQQAYALAEAGLNNAISRLSAALDPRNPSAVPSTTETLTTGTATSSGALTQNSVNCSVSPMSCICFASWPTPCIWTLTATGSVRNPVGGTATPVTRQVSQKVKIVYTNDITIWKYLFSDATAGCMDTKNNALITAPLYVRGNLCLKNNAEFRGSELQVEGTLSLANGAYVRASPPNNPIAVAKLKGGCTGGNPNPHPCTSADRVYATSLTTTPDGLTKPLVDIANWYDHTSRTCTSGSLPGGPPDNNTIRDGSRADFDLTPNTAYSCSTPEGQISWTPGNPGTLAVSGVMFFDGNIYMNNNAYAVYSGKATIYAYGTVNLSNGARLCGITGCTSSWNTAQNVLMFVAGRSLSGCPTPCYGFVLDNHSTYQGAAYTDVDYLCDNGSENWGPVVAYQIQIDNNCDQTQPLSEVPVAAPTPALRSLEIVPDSYSG
jgi:Tfp pilus assembly protein PilX